MMTEHPHQLDFHREEVIHRLEVQSSLGQGALKSMMLVNGAAIVSLLTFIGNKAKLTDVSSIKVSMGMFGAGLFFSLFAYFGAYFSQADFMNTAAYRYNNAITISQGDGPSVIPDIHEKRGTIFLWCSIISLFAALCLFGLGAWYALEGIL